MRRFSMQMIVVASLFASLAMYGCTGQNTGDPTPPKDDHSGHAHNGEHEGHGHPSEGPHHGSLIELGNEEYHAELVHDETSKAVTIYILDSGAKTAVPIEAAELTINLKHQGQAEQHKLTASPDADDPAGKSSRFVSSDAELGDDLEHEGAEPRLVVVIAGKSYSGDIAHHDHDDDDAHGHAHE